MPENLPDTIAEAIASDPSPLVMLIRTPGAKLDQRGMENIRDSMESVGRVLKDRLGYIVPFVYLPDGVTLEAISSPTGLHELVLAMQERLAALENDTRRTE